MLLLLDCRLLSEANLFCDLLGPGLGVLLIWGWHERECRGSVRCARLYRNRHLLSLCCRRCWLVSANVRLDVRLKRLHLH